MSTPNLKYEFFTIHTDSVSSKSWKDSSNAATQHSYTTSLFRPLKNIVQMSILTSAFQVKDSQVVYLHSPQLQSQFNDMAGVVNDSGTTFTISDPIEKDKLRYNLARFSNSDITGAKISTYNQNDFSTQTQYITPIPKLDRIETNLYDKSGNLASLHKVDAGDDGGSNVFVSYRFTCLKENMGPEASKKYKNI